MTTVPDQWVDMADRGDQAFGSEKIMNSQELREVLDQDGKPSLAFINKVISMLVWCIEEPNGDSSTVTFYIKDCKVLLSLIDERLRDEVVDKRHSIAHSGTPVGRTSDSND